MAGTKKSFTSRSAETAAKRIAAEEQTVFGAVAAKKEPPRESGKGAHRVSASVDDSIYVRLYRLVKDPATPYRGVNAVILEGIKKVLEENGA